VTSIVTATCRDQVITDRYAIYNGDCCEIMKGLTSESIHLSIYSPPFGSLLYQYSSDPADLSNCKDYREFFEHYAFVVRELHRLTVPGRMTAVHCQDIFVPGDPQYLIDFPGDIIRLHEADGWRYIARYQVWKEPLLVRNRTMLKSLHHKTMTEDSTKCSIANADVLLIFRRSGKNPIPVVHPRGLTRYAGSRTPPESVLKWQGYGGHQIKNEYSQWVWRQYASSFWDDVRIDRVLPHRQAKEEQDEKHVHPLQQDIIERCCVLWSNPGEVVFTPFMGVGSEVYGAIVNGRKGIGIELKSSYYRQAVKNIEAAVTEGEEQTDLFAGLPDEEERSIAEADDES
jgi:DNA modification methylase